MKLTFHGTRGEIDARTREHARHTATGVSYRGTRILLDAGRDWLAELARLAPQAILLTHAHSDHAGGLRAGAPCPVWATDATSAALADWPLDLRTVVPRRPLTLGSITVEAFPVEHSLVAPAVGFRITAGRIVVFYVPDVVEIDDRDAALRGCRVYVGDGATLVRPLVRKRGSARIGHAPVRTQLAWCEQAGVERAVVTHCGSEIVGGDPARVRTKLALIAAERHVRVDLAYDGMVVMLRDAAPTSPP